MTKKLAGNKELVEAMIPRNFGVGCRRPTVSFVWSSGTNTRILETNP